MIKSLLFKELISVNGTKRMLSMFNWFSILLPFESDYVVDNINRQEMSTAKKLFFINKNYILKFLQINVI